MCTILVVLNPAASEKITVADDALGLKGVAQAVDGRNIEVGGRVHQLVAIKTTRNRIYIETADIMCVVCYIDGGPIYQQHREVDPTGQPVDISHFNVETDISS